MAKMDKPLVLETQIGGDHYRIGLIQPIEYILANDLNFPDGNIVKYITRHRRMGGEVVNDIKKLIQYAEFILQYVYKEKKGE